MCMDALGLRVLDVGCGNGALLAKLAPRLETGVGVDVSAEMLRFAEPRARRHPNLSFLLIEAWSLPFADGSFDVVISLLFATSTRSAHERASLGAACWRSHDGS